MKSDGITLMANGMYACVSKISVLTSNMVSVNRYNAEKQKLVGVLDHF